MKGSMNRLINYVMVKIELFLVDYYNYFQCSLWCLRWNEFFYSLMDDNKDKLVTPHVLQYL